MIEISPLWCGSHQSWSEHKDVLCVAVKVFQHPKSFTIYFVQLPATIELMDDPVRNLWVTSRSHKEQLKEYGHSWTTGMWSKEETKILEDNINRYCRVKFYYMRKCASV